MGEGGAHPCTTPLDLYGRLVSVYFWIALRRCFSSDLGLHALDLTGIPSKWHVLKLEIMKRNNRNETTETSETTEMKPPNERKDRNETTETSETKPPKQAKRPKRPKL